MKHSQVTVRWKEGLHLRLAARIVMHARSFRSSISLRINERMADARSVISLLLLCATFGSVVDLEVSGEDEDKALAAMASVFESADSDGPEGVEISKREDLD